MAAYNGQLYIDNLTVINNTLWMIADDSHGSELWTSDGTPAGTRLFQNIAPAGGSSRISDLTAVGEQMMFVVDDHIHGDELWRIARSTPTISQRLVWLPMVLH